MDLWMMLGCTLRLVSKSLCWMTRCSRESRSRGTGADRRRLSVCSASSSFDCSVDNCSVSTRTAFLPSSTSKHKYKLYNTELGKRRENNCININYLLFLLFTKGFFSSSDYITFFAFYYTGKKAHNSDTMLKSISLLSMLYQQLQCRSLILNPTLNLSQDTIITRVESQEVLPHYARLVAL